MTERAQPCAGPSPPNDATAAYIRHGTSAFRDTNLALFAAGFATVGPLYCVQPLIAIMESFP